MRYLRLLAAFRTLRLFAEQYLIDDPVCCMAVIVAEVFFSELQGLVQFVILGLKGCHEFIKCVADLTRSCLFYALMYSADDLIYFSVICEEEYRTLHQ